MRYPTAICISAVLLMGCPVGADTINVPGDQPTIAQRLHYIVAGIKPDCVHSQTFCSFQVVQSIIEQQRFVRCYAHQLNCMQDDIRLGFH